MADMINHPAHYNHSKVEPIKAIEAWGLGFHLGNVVKYIARAGHKDPSKKIEDLKKARFYLDREIQNLEKAEKNKNPEGPGVGAESVEVTIPKFTTTNKML